MLQSEYDLLRTLDISENRKKIDKLVDELVALDKGFEFIKDSIISKEIIAYVLLRMKSTNRPDILDILWEEFDNNERIEFPAMMFEEVLQVGDDIKEQYRDIFWNNHANFNEEELKAYILFENAEDDYDPVPNSIYELAYNLLRIQPDDHVGLFECERSSYWIDHMAMKNGIHTSVYSNYAILHWVYLRSHVLGIELDLMSDDMPENCDNAFINTPLVSKMYCRYNIWEDIPGIPKDCTPSWTMISSVFFSMEESGRAVAVINGGALNDKTSIKVREYYVQNGFVEGVIILPEKMYADTWVSPHLLILSRGNHTVKFFDARPFKTPDRNKGKRINLILDNQISQIVQTFFSDETTEISNDVIIRNDSNLNPIRYIEPQASMDKHIVLKTIIKDVKRGVSLTGKEIDEQISAADSSLKKCILPQHLSHGVITECLYINNNFSKRMHNNEAYPGDILITKSGNPFNVAVSDDHYVVVGNVYILKLKDSTISPYYLKCFLESRAGQAELLRYSTGAKTPIISISNLEKVRIPMLEDSKMEYMNRRAEQLTKETDECLKKIYRNQEAVSSLFE